jgi:transposase-like protein
MAGTIFQDTHFSLLLWFRIMWLVMSQKFGANAKGLMRVLSLSYATVWNVLHKLRRAMVRSEREKLKGTVEVDEAYVGGHEEGRLGRGAAKKSLVAVAVELTDGNIIGRIRMAVINDATAVTLHDFIDYNVEPGSEVVTDGWKGYSGLEFKGFSHSVKPMKKDKEALPHVHLVISLAKRWLLGTFQGAVSHRYLDYYLDEYVFRFNRRKSRSRGKLFRRLMEQAVVTSPVTRDELKVLQDRVSAEEHEMRAFLNNIMRET